MQFDVIVLDGTYSEVPGPSSRVLSLARKEPEFAFSEFLAHVHALCNKPKVGHVLVLHRKRFRVPGFAVLEEIGSQLKRLAEAGKEIHFYAEEYTESTAFLASFAAKRYMHPLGAVRLLGFSQSMLYIRPLLNRLGIEPIVARRGRYKSAADALEYDRRRDADAEQIRRYLDVTDARVAARLRYGEGIGQDISGESGSGDPKRDGEGVYLFGQQAVDHGWVDELKTEEELRHARQEAKQKQTRLRRKPHRYGKGKRIAVLVVEGTIADGESKNGGGVERQAGSRTIAELAKKLKDDKKVAAVVVRINSPGGSATASETMRQALQSLAEKKPVQLSFGALAASGGYWIATLKRRIFASDTTVTGSIGALLLYPNMQSLLRKWGINSDSVKTGSHADFPSPLRPIDAVERDYLERELDELYRQFLERVSEARSIDLDTADSLGQGRVWAGVDARDNGLADSEGGLVEAIESLRGELGVRKASVHFYPRAKPSLLQRIIAKRGLNSSAEAVHASLVGLAGLQESWIGVLLARVMPLLGRAAPLAALPLKTPLLFAHDLPAHDPGYGMT